MKEATRKITTELITKIEPDCRKKNRRSHQHLRLRITTRIEDLIMKRWNPEGAIAVLTGASSGIGRCLTHQLADCGATVIAVARREPQLTETVSSWQSKGQGRILPLVGDITDPETHLLIKNELTQLTDDHRLDLLVNNAGVGAIGPFAEATPQRLRQVMEINFFSAAELTRTLLPSLRQSSSPVICNIGSVLGHCAVPDKSEYCASKFALHGWSDALRCELACEGFQVTLVSPSTTRSEFFHALIETDSKTKSKSLGSWPADRVAAATLNAIIRRKREVVLSIGGKLLVYADRLIPGIMNKFLKRPHYAVKANVN